MTTATAATERRSPSAAPSPLRSDLIDYMRGALIILVVFGHSMQFNMYNGSDGYWTDPIFKFIYMFHMPMFMLISGYVSYLSASRKRPIDAMKARLTQLVIPTMVWSLIQTIVMSVANAASGTPIASRRQSAVRFAHLRSDSGSSPRCCSRASSFWHSASSDLIGR